VEDELTITGAEKRNRGAWKRIDQKVTDESRGE